MLENQVKVEVLRIINEPTAASLAYGLDTKKTKRLKRRTKTHKDTDNFLCHGRLRTHK
jgi:hypothetical protein